MLRALVAVLLLANGLVFAWARGWLEPGFPAPHHGEREPERLAAQVRPEAVRVLPAKAASAAVSAAIDAARAGAVCLEVGPFGEAEVTVAENALAAATPPPGSWAREPVPDPRWAVYAGRYADAAVRRSREAELRKLGLEVQPVSEPPELAPGLMLGRHLSREAAEAALAALPTPGGKALRGLRVLELPAAPPRYWLRVPAAEADLAERLKALPADALGARFSVCAKL